MVLAPSAIPGTNRPTKTRNSEATRLISIIPIVVGSLKNRRLMKPRTAEIVRTVATNSKIDMAREVRIAAMTVNYLGVCSIFAP